MLRDPVFSANSIVQVAPDKRKCKACLEEIAAGAAHIVLDMTRFYHAGCCWLGDEEIQDILREGAGFEHKGAVASSSELVTETSTAQLELEAEPAIAKPSNVKPSDVKPSNVKPSNEHERATKASEDWAALKAQHPFLSSRVHDGAVLTPDALVRLLSQSQLQTCVEGVTGKRAKRSLTKPALAALFLEAGAAAGC